MTIKEAENFYKQDSKKYELENNKSFLIWFKNTIKEGYYAFMDIPELQDFINRLVNWYELKYPERVLEYDQNIFQERFKNITDISKEMDIQQLMYRLSRNQLALLDCGYRAKGWGQHPIYKNNKVIAWKSNIFMRISKKDANDFDFLHGNDPYFLLYADPKTGEISKDSNGELQKYLDGEKKVTLEQLLSILKNGYTDTLDFTELEECIFDHQSDVELRHRVLELAALKMIYSNNTVPERGYQRAIKFIEEFNKEFKLALTTDEIEKIMQKDYSKNEEQIIESEIVEQPQEEKPKSLVKTILNKRFKKNNETK